MNNNETKYIMERRHPDLRFIIDSIILTNDKRLCKPFPLKMKDDKSFYCPNCDRTFKPVQYQRKKIYTRRDRRILKHYYYGACNFKKETVKAGYLRDKDKRNDKLCLTTAVQYLLGIGNHYISKLQHTVVSNIFNNNYIIPNIKVQTFNISELDRVYESSFIQKIPSYHQINTKKEINDYEEVKNIPKFDNIDKLEQWVKDRIKYVTKIRGVEFMTYMPSFKNSERWRTIPPLSKGNKDYLDLIGYSIENEPKRRKVGLLSK